MVAIEAVSTQIELLAQSPKSEKLQIVSPPSEQSPLNCEQAPMPDPNDDTSSVWTEQQDYEEKGNTTIFDCDLVD